VLTTGLVGHECCNPEAWPKTFFIGRNGRVTIHAGYSGPATGSGNSDLRREVNTLVNELLSENERVSIDERGPIH
jgi:hypothetical protein